MQGLQEETAQEEGQWDEERSPLDHNITNRLARDRVDLELGRKLVETGVQPKLLEVVEGFPKED